VAMELYGLACPVALVAERDWAALGLAARLRVRAEAEGAIVERA